MNDKKTTRVQMELPHQSFRRLENIKEITEAVSYAQVFSQAMKLYEWCIEQTVAGGKLQLVRPDGTIETLALFFDIPPDDGGARKAA